MKKSKKSYKIFPKSRFYYVIHMQGLQKNFFFENFQFFSYKNIQNRRVVFYYPELPRRDHIFLKLFLAVYFGVWVICFPFFPEKKFILLSKFDKINQKIITKTTFFWLETLQFQLHCLSAI